MAPSLERIAADEPEEVDASELGSPRPLESNSDIADELRDLVRLAHDSYLPPSRDADVDVRVLKYTKVQRILANPVTQRRVISLGDNDAEAVLDLLQEWLDWAPVDHSERRRVIHVLVKLSIGSTKIPRLLYVSNIILTSRDPWKSGGFADILRATCNDTAVVLKRLRVPCADGQYPDLHRKLRREALVWRQLRHQFILPLIGIDATTFANTLPCLVSPWMRQGTLKEYLRSTYYTASRDFYRLLLEAAEGLAYLHSQEVVHGDIKDVNILITDDYHVQLCDFGLVVVGNMTDDGWTTTAQATGTIRWMSPQRLDSMHTSYRITEADDVYALGCLYYYLSTGHAPFHDLTDFKAQTKIMVEEVRPSRPTEENVRTLVTDDLWSMVELCWAHEAAIRPTIASVVTRLIVIKLGADAKRKRDIDVASTYDLSEHLMQRLEALVHDSDDIQVALDILDRALLASDTSHPMYGLSVRRLLQWSRTFALLPSSLIPIKIKDIQLESDLPSFATSSSDVFRGIYDGRMVAVKVMRQYGDSPSVHAQKSYRNEVVIWRHLRHPNIAPFLGVCDKSPLCLVSDWMNEGTLSDFFRKHPTEPRTSYILGTVRGLDFLHSLGFAHGNIRPMNILVDDEHNARLSGFELVSLLDPGYQEARMVGGNHGALRYQAPELLENDDRIPRTSLSDIYALAITIWEIFTSKTPFAHIANDFKIYMQVLRGERPVMPTGCENIGFTEGLWNLMKQGWSQKPASRPPLSAFIEALGLQG